ncbi:uncharacterized protein LOC128956908 [Oppia nitens]|uniref:uncharacterized protein LOC128956908 n=1 Tax=Oppia nitens TaxID=1686743 RepID=UPI0023DBB2CA|nr:uncharacterized protein LOC128956908 [Oppia nitens]
MAVSVNYINRNYPSNSYKKELALSWILSVSLIGLLVQLLGLCAIYTVHYCTIIMYSLLVTIVTGLGIYSAALWSQLLLDWLVQALYFVCTCMSWLIVIELSQIRAAAGGGGAHNKAIVCGTGATLPPSLPCSMDIPISTIPLTPPVGQPLVVNDGPAVLYMSTTLSSTSLASSSSSSGIYPLNPGANSHVMTVDRLPSYQQTNG